MPMKSMMGADEGEMDSLYAGGEPEGGKSEGKESIDQEAAENADTALAPVKVLHGKDGEPLKVVDEVVVKILALHGDEAEFSYSETKPSEIGGGGEESPDAEIDKMDNPGGGSSY